MRLFEQSVYDRDTDKLWDEAQAARQVQAAQHG